LAAFDSVTDTPIVFVRFGVRLTAPFNRVRLTAPFDRVRFTSQVLAPYKDAFYELSYGTEMPSTNSGSSMSAVM